MSTKVAQLARVPLFEGLSPSDVEHLASGARVESFAAGQNIVEIGEPGRSLYLLTDGVVQVVYPARESEFELARLGEGDFFGEMALLNDKPRSATVRAVTDVEALVVDKDSFHAAIIGRPKVGIQLLEALSVRIRHADEQISGLSDQVVRDPLTLLLNRRAFTQRMDEEVDRARRYHESFSLILMDVDHFKAINDTLGHDVGDEVLTWIGRVLTEHTRGADVPFRIGGEEFAILCPGTPAELTRSVAQRLLEIVGEAKPPGGHDIHVTISASYANCPDHGEAFEVLFNAADQGLLAAKQEGRNRVSEPRVPETAG
jgi:diguanylate cyclase (GGDEF)-like protein